MIKCPDCKKILSTRFPIHKCIPPKHINKVADKRASNLAQTTLVKDTYHDNIQKAAQELCAYKSDLKNFLSVCVYRNQWKSGTTLWSHPENGTVTVDIDGKMDISEIPEPM